MKSYNMHIFVALTALTITACGNNEEPVKVTASTTTSLQITPSPQTPHTIGEFDPATKSIVAKKDEAGAIMFGPYAKLQPGKYEVTYFVTAESEVDGVEVGILDVAGYIPPSVDDNLARVSLKSVSGEQVVRLIFESKNPAYEFQFRVWANGKGNRVSVRSVQVQKLKGSED